MEVQARLLPDGEWVSPDEALPQSRSQLRRLETDKNWKDSRPHLILISGKAGVGKTTLAQTLTQVVRDQEDHKSVILKQALAWGVKQVAVDMGWDWQKDVKGRRLLQGIGSIGRAYNVDVWVEIAAKAITDTQYHFGSFEDKSLRYIWVDDWRFRNEARYFKDMDYMFRIKLVKIVAPDREILKGTPEALDISEVDLDNFTEFDFVIDNQGSLDELWASANAIYKSIQ